MTSTPVSSQRNAFVEDGVKLVLGGITVEHSAALHDMTSIDVLASLYDSAPGIKVVDLDEVDAWIVIKRKEAGHAA